MKNIVFSFNIIMYFLGGGILVGTVVTTLFFKRKYMTHFSWIPKTCCVGLYCSWLTVTESVKLCARYAVYWHHLASSEVYLLEIYMPLCDFENLLFFF
jgi:hypothetical protein